MTPPGDCILRPHCLTARVKTLPPSIVSVSANVLRVFITYFLAKTALGLSGIWLGISLAAALRGTCSLAWYLLAAKRQPREDVS